MKTVHQRIEKILEKPKSRTATIENVTIDFLGTSKASANAKKFSVSLEAMKAQENENKLPPNMNIMLPYESKVILKVD